MTTPRLVKRAISPLDAAVKVPGSKSGTIRALAVATMARGRSHIYGGLASEDASAMTESVQAFGADVDTSGEPWSVDGAGVYLQAPAVTLDARESGLTARICMAMAALADGRTTIDGRGRLRQRPMSGLVELLTRQGVEVETTDGLLPVTVNGQGRLWGGEMTVDCTETSQFATAALLTAPMTMEPTVVRLDNLTGSAGYLDVTVEIMEAFGATVSPQITGYEITNDGYRPTDYLVEKDVSAAVYPMVAVAIVGGRLILPGISLRSRQPDSQIARRLGQMGCFVEDTEEGLLIEASQQLTPIDADLSGAPDGALALIVACLFASGTSTIRGLHSLAHKESDRIGAMVDAMTRLGAVVQATSESITVTGDDLHGASLDPHGDHRIAMACALAGLVVDDVRVEHPEVVNKTWPGYWEMLEHLAGETASSGVSD